MAGLELTTRNRLLLRKSLIWLLTASVFCFSSTESFSARVTLDMAGRKVSLPESVRRILPMDFKTNLLLFPLASDLMVARAKGSVSLHPSFINAAYMKLPEADTRNTEEVMKLKPDLVLASGFLSDKTNHSDLDAFTRKTGIPVVVIDLELTNLDRSFEFLGKLLGRQGEAAIRAAFLREIFADLARLGDEQAHEDQVYFAYDKNGLRTPSVSSSHAELLNVMNIRNVSEKLPDTGGFSMISIEQLLMNNPDAIFCIGKGSHSPWHTIRESPLWRNMNAVRKNRVYQVPNDPFLWLDMPPSVNRIAGILWFLELFYGQDKALTRQRIKEFYKIFYLYELSDAEYYGMLKTG